MVSFKLPPPLYRVPIDNSRKYPNIPQCSFFCHSKILHENCLWFLLEVKMASRETTENFAVTNKEHYGMLCFFHWSGQLNFDGPS